MPGAALLPLLCLLASELPAPGGPHTVGTRVLYLSDPGRKDLRVPERARELLVQLWYPAEDAQRRERMPYLVELELVEVLAEGRYLDLEPETVGAWADLRTHARRDAPLAASPARLPLLFLSPGMGMARCSYTTLATELASHGLVVAAIDHPYCGVTVGSDGRVRTNGQDPRGAEAVVERVEEMARDARFVLDALLAPEGELAARLDAGRVAVAGHSLGGAMALEAARVDARFRAAIDLDGAPFGRVEEEGVARAALVVLNQPELSKRPPPAMGKERHDAWVAIFAHHDTPAYLATVENTDHFSFSDAPFLLAPELRARSGATLAAPRNLELVVRLLRAFLADALDLPGGEALADVARAFPEIQLEAL
ncbi:MAG TPA: alpha/beta fold hydrolase [Planctomycetota bacterium]